MAVYGYIFIAREDDELVESDAQRSELEMFAKSSGVVIDEYLFEEGSTLKSPFKERPSGSKLYRQCEHGDIIVVLRSQWILGCVSDAARLVRVLRKNGISLYCADLGGDITMDEKRRLAVFEGHADIVAKLLNALAVCDSSKHGEAIRATKRSRKREGKYLGGPVPFGWEVNKNGYLVQEPGQQRIIRRILAMREDRWSYRDISKKLKLDYNVQLSHEGVRRILEADKRKKTERPPVRSKKEAENEQ